MYGVSPDLDLSAFVGATLIQVCIGAHDLQLHFSRAGDGRPGPSIAIWSRFELRNGNDEILEVGTPTDTRTRQLPALLNVAVSRAEAEPPVAIALIFATGHALRIVDDSKEYESFVIEPGAVIV